MSGKWSVDFLVLHDRRAGDDAKGFVFRQRRDQFVGHAVRKYSSAAPPERFSRGRTAMDRIAGCADTERVKRESVNL